MRPALTFGLAWLVAGCSWSRFDDITASPPVVLLEKPESMQAGFGHSLATFENSEQTLLFVGGSAGVSAAATFDLGLGQSPDTGAVDRAYCNGAQGQCFISSSPAALPAVSVDGSDHEGCFALGVGESPLDGAGLLVRCMDDTLFSYPLPDDYAGVVDVALSLRQPAILALSSDGSGDEPWLLAASVGESSSWFYRFDSSTPVSLAVPGGAPEGYGKVVRALSAPGGERLLAVGNPDDGEVYLFRADQDSATFIGCLGGTAGFGRTMTSGTILADDDVPELVISDDNSVHVLDGAALLDLPATDSAVCSLAALPEGALLASLGCSSRQDIANCGSSSFGASLAIGDLDGDGDGELGVGAPGMIAREVSSAGAVLIFDVEEAGDTALTEYMFVASAEGGDRLGGSVALPRVGERSIVAAGAPGNGKVALFYCSSLLPAEAKGSRCE